MSDRIERHDDRRRQPRSRSPSRHEEHALHRKRSPHRHHHHRHNRPPVKADALKELPYGARQLTKRDSTVFWPMFALYLDIQKQKVLEDLDEVEAKGRWKSFMGKWNRAELAEGWYDPSTLQKAIASSLAEHQAPSREDPSPRGRENHHRQGTDMAVVEQARDRDSISESESDDDSVGPALPGKESRSRSARMGPSIPRADDLALKREMEEEDALARTEEMRHKRQAERRSQKEALDELAPRAAAGTFERRLEKKADTNASMKSFRERRSPGAAEVPEAELMGAGAGDGISDFKKQKQEFERKKNERELRKEEFLRARAAEREERLQDYAAKEGKTMAMLKELAKQRFG